jgi:hypothetical protein
LNRQEKNRFPLQRYEAAFKPSYKIFAKQKGKHMKICIYGSAGENIDSIYKDKAYRFGALMAEHSHELIFGGGNTGLMGCTARGAKSKQGKVIGIAPEFFTQVDGELYPLCDEMILTASMNERKALLKEKSDAFVILPGGIGTYDEFFDTLVSVSLGIDTGKKLAIFNIKGYYDSLRSLLLQTVQQGFMAEEKTALYRFFDDESELLSYLEQ